MAAGLTGEQGFAHLFFQGLDAARDGGVFHAGAARRGGQRAGTGQFQEIAQVLPIHKAFAWCSMRGLCCAISQSARAIFLY